MPDGSLQRARLLFKLGRTRFIAGDFEAELLTTASAELVALGAGQTAAEAESILAELKMMRGERDSANEHLQRAGSMVNDHAPSPAKAQVITRIAGHKMLSGEFSDAVQMGNEALAMVESLGLDDLRARLFDIVGVNRVIVGDFGGIDDLEQSATIALAANQTAEFCWARGNLATALLLRGELRLALEVHAEAVEAASRFGQAQASRWFRGESIGIRYTLGDWNEALECADRFLAEVEGDSPHYHATACYSTRALIRLARDDILGAVDDADRALELARTAKDAQVLCTTAAATAVVFLESGQAERAATLVDTFLAELRAGRAGYAIVWVHMVAWIVTALGRGQDLIDALPNVDMPWVQAATAFVEGDRSRAADICGVMGAVVEEARDRLVLAEDLLAQDRRAEADFQVMRALSFYQSVDALRYVSRGEAVLSAATNRQHPTA